MTLPDTLTQRLQTIAEREGRTPEAFLQALLDAYEQRTTDENALDAFIGAFDDDVTDLSTRKLTVDEKMRLLRTAQFHGEIKEEPSPRREDWYDDDGR